MFTTIEAVKALSKNSGAITRGFLDADFKPHTEVKVRRLTCGYGVSVVEYNPEPSRIEGRECWTAKEAVEQFNSLCESYLPGKKWLELNKNRVTPK